jgi:aspartyl-tRNA(Asn)/glutamyl-tRNA(Gln) amidotransferase subunit A
MSLADATASESWADLIAGRVSSRELTQACLDRIARQDGKIGAFLSVRKDQALTQAGEIDRRRRSGAAVGRLAGLPVAVKDVLCIKGEPTTCASRILEHFRPPYDATVVHKLREADAVLIGKTNMDEFAMGGSNENSAFRVARNPWKTAYIPGGSSGGSAASVAAGMVPLSIGSDTGGSVRQPAALCGVCGLKPTYGRVSRFGLVAFASSLDQVGPLGRSAEDIALLLAVIAGYDPRDSTSVDHPTPDYVDAVRQPLSGLRIGIVPEHFGPGLDPEVEKAVREAARVFKDRGASVHEVSLPASRFAVATYYVIACCEASSNLSRYDGAHYGYRCDERTVLEEWSTERGRLEKSKDAKALDELDNPLVRMYRQTRAEGFGPEVKRRIMLGTYALSAGYYDAYYLKALKVRRLIRNDFDRAFGEVDLILGPVSPTPAFKIGDKVNDPLAMYLDDLYTTSANLAGICALSIPCGFSRDGLPIGLQLQGPPFAEEKLLQAAYLFQEVTDWHRKSPVLE